MRFIVYGIGAIGGTVASSFALSGQEVVGIARGRQFEAIHANGLLLRSPAGEERVHFDCVASPADIDFRDDDAIVLTMKSQDTWDALLALRAAGVREQAIVCAQNGVANERMAARLFPNVYGVTVILPATYETPGEVNAFGAPKRGLFYLGAFPKGTDATGEAIAAGFIKADIACDVLPDIMRYKYGKLISNIGAISMAALGANEVGTAWTKKTRDEAQEIYAKAGIASGRPPMSTTPPGLASCTTRLSRVSIASARPRCKA